MKFSIKSNYFILKNIPSGNWEYSNTTSPTLLHVYLANRSGVERFHRFTVIRKY